MRRTVLALQAVALHLLRRGSRLIQDFASRAGVEVCRDAHDDARSDGPFLAAVCAVKDVDVVDRHARTQVDLPPLAAVCVGQRVRAGAATPLAVGIAVDRLARHVATRADPGRALSSGPPLADEGAEAGAGGAGPGALPRSAAAVAGADSGALALVDAAAAVA